MRLKKTYLIIAVLVFVEIYSCSKNSPSPSIANLSFKINGVAKSTNTISTTTASGPAQVVVLATFNTGESLNFTIINPKVGSFDVYTGAATIAYAADTASIHLYKGATGTVTLSSYSNNNIAGTFEFTGKNVAQSSVSITEGVFKAN